MIDSDGAIGLMAYYGNDGDDDDDGSHIPFAALEASHHHHIFSFIPVVVKIILFSNIITSHQYITTKGLVPFTQLVKVWRVTRFWHQICMKLLPDIPWHYS